VNSSGAQVAELPPILTGTIQDGTTKPYIDVTDFRTIVFDSQTIVDQVERCPSGALSIEVVTPETDQASGQDPPG
jgi:hypothetical protein